jgi:hypothetical protein
MSKITAIESLKHFYRSVIAVFGDKYWRAPTAADTQLILSYNKKRSLPVMLGSLDCMHWAWMNFSIAWCGKFRGKNMEPTIILKAIAMYNLSIWHVFFEMPGFNNNLNVPDRSPLFAN